MDKGKLIFFGVIGLVTFLIIIYAISLTGNKSDGGTDDFDVPDMVKSDGKDHYASRLAKANKNKRPPKDNVKRNVEFKTYTDSSNLDSVPGNSKVDEELNNDAVESKDNTYNPNTASQTYSKPKSSNTHHTQKNTPTPKSNINEPSKKKEKKYRGGFGISKSKDVNSNDKKELVTEKSEVKINNTFIPLSLEDDITIKDGTNIAFILLDNFTVDGTEFKKNAIVFGKATRQNQTFDISVYQIKNTDGNLYNLSTSNIYVFDEKYSRGLQFEGDFEESMKESSEDVALNTSTSKIGIAESGARIVDKVVRNVARKKEPSIGLLKGYRIYIKRTQP